MEEASWRRKHRRRDVEIGSAEKKNHGKKCRGDGWRHMAGRPLSGWWGVHMAGRGMAWHELNWLVIRRLFAAFFLREKRRKGGKQKEKADREEQKEGEKEERRREKWRERGRQAKKGRGQVCYHLNHQVLIAIQAFAKYCTYTAQK